MSKYEPLKRHLAERSEAEAPMTFQELESILGFRLPNSARSYPAWWSNNVGTHVNAAAWREAGWKTSRIDLSAERVTFVRESAPSKMAVFADDTEDHPSIPRNETGGSVAFDELGSTERHCIELICEELSVDRGSAMRHALKEWAVDRRRRFVEALPRARMPHGFDSTDLIRADRDAH